MKTLAGKVALITGGTSGIGLALAEAMSAAGASVAVCGRSADALAAVRRALPAALAIQADVTAGADRQAMLDAVQARFGRLDILVNNAGRMVERDFSGEPIADADLADEIALNLIAPIQLTAAAMQRWRTLDAIVFVSSGYALVSPRRSPTYGAAKAGLHAFSDGLREQLRETGTHVLEVLPPAVDTAAIAHRNVKKISPDAVAAATLKALSHGNDYALVGDTRFLPLALRIAPSWIRKKVSQT